MKDTSKKSTEKLDELRTVLEHMENRTQWHTKDIERVESLRNEVAAHEHGGKVPEAIKAKNKVVHYH